MLRSAIAIEEYLNHKFYGGVGNVSHDAEGNVTVVDGCRRAKGPYATMREIADSSASLESFWQNLHSYVFTIPPEDMSPEACETFHRKRLADPEPAVKK